MGLSTLPQLSCRKTRSDRLSDKAAELDAPGIVLFSNNGAYSSSRVAHPSSGGFFCFCPAGRETNSEFRM
jgi:hypothetical protein